LTANDGILQVRHSIPMFSAVQLRAILNEALSFAWTPSRVKKTMATMVADKSYVADQRYNDQRSALTLMTMQVCILISAQREKERGCKLHNDYLRYKIM
jgi:hypothetical protein